MWKNSWKSAGCRSGFVAKLPFRGKIRKSCIGKSMTCESKLSCFRSFATEPLHDLLSKICDKTLRRCWRHLRDNAHAHNTPLQQNAQCDPLVERGHCPRVDRKAPGFVTQF